MSSGAVSRIEPCERNMFFAIGAYREIAGEEDAIAKISLTIFSPSRLCCCRASFDLAFRRRRNYINANTHATRGSALAFPLHDDCIVPVFTL